MVDNNSNISYKDYEAAQTAKPVEHYMPSDLVERIFNNLNLKFNIGSSEFQVNIETLLNEYIAQLKYESPEMRPYVVQAFWKKLFTEIIFGLKMTLGELARKYNPSISEQHSPTYLRDDMTEFINRFIIAVETIRNNIGDSVITMNDIQHYLDNSFTEFRPTFKGVLLEVISKFSHIMSMHYEMREYLDDLLYYLVSEELMEDYVYAALTNYEDSL